MSNFFNLNRRISVRNDAIITIKRALIFTLIILMNACSNSEKCEGDFITFLSSQSEYSTNNILLYGKGWYAQEAGGRWTNGDYSDLLMITRKKNINKLTVVGHYFSQANKKPCIISINDQEIGHLKFIPNQKVHNWTFDLPRGIVKTDRENKVTFKNSGPIFSPKDLGLSEDNRKIKFTLNRIVLK